MTWPTDDYDVFTDPVSDTPLSGPHRSTTVVAAIHTALRALQRKVGFDVDPDADTLDSQMRLHGHPHTLIGATTHTDTAGSTPSPGQVLAFLPDDAEVEAWRPSDPSTTDHGSLSGLHDLDDHPQYGAAAEGYLAEEILDNRVFRSHAFSSPSGTSSRTVFIAPFDCRLRGVHGYLRGGTTASVDVLIDGVGALATDLALTTDAGASDLTPDVAIPAGAIVDASITAIGSAATSLFVQADIERIGA